MFMKAVLGVKILTLAPFSDGGSSTKENCKLPTCSLPI